MSDTMYALVKTEAGPGLSLERIPIPETGPNDVKIKIRKTAICGTDCHIYNWDCLLYTSLCALFHSFS